MTRSIRSVKAQYFLAYAPLGSLGPLLPVFLKDSKGFTEWHFGMLIAATAARGSPAERRPRNIAP